MKPKDNYCEVEFYCKEPKRNKCVYFFKTKEHEDCKYMNGAFCESEVANVNRMTLLLEQVTL